MQTQRMIEALQEVFIAADERDWERCRNAMADKVYLDYSSLSGVPAQELAAADIVTSWMGFLPRFKATHHQLGNFTVQDDGENAIVKCYGTATHYFPAASGQNVWTVVGTYEAKLARWKDGWKVTALRFNLRYQDGNLALPEIAAVE